MYVAASGSSSTASVRTGTYPVAAAHCDCFSALTRNWMKSHAAAAWASPLSATMYSDAPPTTADGVSPGPGIGPTPTSALVQPGDRARRRGR